MGVRSDSENTANHPIGEGLDEYRRLFRSTCADLGISESPDAKNLVLKLVLALQDLPAAWVLPPKNATGVLLDDIVRFAPSAIPGRFSVRQTVTLCERVIEGASDAEIWSAVYDLIRESTPPPRPLPYLDHTPISFNTGSFANTSEYRKQFDGALKDELDSSLYIDVPGFFDAYFGGITNLISVAEAVFKKCQESETPLYKEGEAGGWRDWPKDAQEDKVLKWFKEWINVFLEFAKENGSAPNVQRRPLGQPIQPLSGSTTQRKLDIGFADDKKTNETLRYDWSDILVPGELKSNPKADGHTNAWLDLARYARHVLTTQDSRRFVLGFTICGSIMRLWEFDRLGGIASSPFDINKDGLQFVSVVLGYLWMSEEQLGFDPTISESDGKRYIEITRNDQKERLVIVELLKRHSSVAGRATTCWKAYRDGDKSKRILVIKDLWQYPERKEEGELLREAIEKGVINVARYYHHETVRVGGKDDVICDNVRKGLDVTSENNAFGSTSTTSKTQDMMPPRSTSGASVGGGRRGRSGSNTRKRSSSSIQAPLPPSKRSRSNSQHEGGSKPGRRNRVHRRIVVCDYGKNIYKASSRVAMLTALERNIKGHESLRELTGVIQSDISIGNLMMNEEEDNPSWPSFLIDLDLAIEEDRITSSGTPNKTGTRAFMALGALMGEKHSFMHDLESFFWVIFWICTHYNGPGEEARVTEFGCWNYENTTKLAELKSGLVDRERHFINRITKTFTPYYQPLAPWVNRLRRVVFPKDKPWENQDEELYSQMKEVLEKAREDPLVWMEL